MKNALRIAPFVLTLLSVGAAQADTVTFSEILLPTGHEMSNEYAAYNLTVVNTFYAIDPRFSDGYGIAETKVPATINFINPVTDLSIDWLSANTDFFATAYDANGTILSTYLALPCGSVCTGVADLAGADISRVVWHDTASYVGIDSLSFTLSSDPPADPPVPESSGFLILLAFLPIVILSKRHGGASRLPGRSARVS